MTDTKDGGDEPANDDAGPAAGRVQYGDQSAHLAFQQQIADMLARADITEEQRQQILIAATCPCCGTGGLSISLKIKSGDTPGF